MAEEDWEVEDWGGAVGTLIVLGEVGGGGGDDDVGEWEGGAEEGNTDGLEERAIEVDPWVA